VYYDGDKAGIPKDDKEAIAWFRKAADQGDARAQLALGTMYARGDGVPKDAKEAVVWVRKAADQRLAQAQFSLGGMYARGEGVPQDKVLAYMWFNLAAGDGLKDAQSARNALEGLTLTEVERAQLMTREWIENHRK
jgi:TPR repeat protein